MGLENLLAAILSGELLHTYLPDFVLAFAFFTSVIYAVLGRRFGQQRPAIAMSASLGLALAAGLVWWEQSRGLSIRDLGSVAVGFAIIILAGVMYQAIRQVGGNWAGAGIAFGACALVGWVLGIRWPVRPEIVQTLVGVALTVGILAFLLNRTGNAGRLRSETTDFPKIRHDMRDLDQGQRVSRGLDKGLRRAHKDSKSLNERPEGADDVMLQLKRMLPAEGWLTERMARLRERMYLTRRGDVAKLKETRDLVSKIPGDKRKQIAAELARRYGQLTGIDKRLERLDNAVAVNERRIRELTRQAQAYLNANQYNRLPDLLKEASKLQHHNSRIFRTIDRTEKNLAAVAAEVAKDVKEVNRA
jgi:hypothetical protein